MKNKKLKIQLLSISILIILILLSYIVLNITNSTNNQKTTLIQLSAQTSRQMMGYIIKTVNNKIIVIDGGTIDDTDNLIKNIKNNGSKVDYWFLTHAHDDHTGAFTKVIEDNEIQIDNIYVSLNDYFWYEKYEPSRKDFTKTLIDTLNKDEIKDKVKEPKLNENIKIDNMQIEILGIKNPEITENSGNEQSMIIKLDTGKTSMLILGDAGIKSSEKLIKNQNKKLKSDIVQMAHHGQAGVTEEIYKQIKPKICLWPTPEWLWDNNENGKGKNTGMWKTNETKDWTKKLKVDKNYISKDGDITIKLD